MGKEEDIDRLVNVLQSTKSVRFTKLAQEIIDAGFGYIGNTDAKQPAQHGELTRELIESAISTMTTSNAADAIFSRILSDRAATEARVMAECLEGSRLSREKREREIADLRATIADLEKRLENSIEIPPLDEWHDDALEIRVAYTFPESNFIDVVTIKTYPRPTPAKLTPEQMAEEWLDWAQDQPNMAKLVADALDKGKSIETLYAEINGVG